MAVVNMDAFEFLDRLGDESVDMVCTDIPYESLEKHRARGTTTRLSHSKASSNDWFQILPNAEIPRLLAELWRVLKKNSHLYMFCDDETSNIIWQSAQALRPHKSKRLVWDKQKMGMGYTYRASYEFIYFLEKGSRKLNDLGIRDVISVPRVKSKGSWPTEKPVEVSEVLIRQSTEPGERVIDPFCGSGSVGVAAARLGRKFAGSDICAEAVEITKNRLTLMPNLVSSPTGGSCDAVCERRR